MIRVILTLEDGTKVKAMMTRNQWRKVRRSIGNVECMTRYERFKQFLGWIWDKYEPVSQ